VKIDRIFIACFKGDVRFTRACVASIRQWYPNIRISLLKDCSRGAFSTQDIETTHNVDIFPTLCSRSGWGLSKLEPLFIKDRTRCLIMDSDIVFLGLVLDRLDKSNADFIVSGIPLNLLSQRQIERFYVNPILVNLLDSDFKYPPFLFNSGQVVATTGLFLREDFNQLIVWEERQPRLIHPEIFRCQDQGVLNYFLQKMSQVGRINLESINFALLPELNQGKDLESAASLIARGGLPLLMHWAGMKKLRLKRMMRSDLILYFEDRYFDLVRLGAMKKHWLALTNYCASACLLLSTKSKIWAAKHLGLDRNHVMRFFRIINRQN
jgi:hypothetical protein